MLQQPHAALERLVALTTPVGPLLRVRPLVDAQVAGCGKPLSAGLAGVRSCPRVDGLVLPEALLPGETLTADITHEGLYLGVRNFVIPECTGGGKGAVAGVALQWGFLQSVGGLVHSELPQQSELPVTLVAAQQLVWVTLLRLPQLVAQLVLVQRLCPVKTLITGAARERLQVARHVLHQLVLLMEAFVAELTEEPLLFVQLPPSPPLLLFLLFLTLSFSTTGGTVKASH